MLEHTSDVRSLWAEIKFPAKEIGVEPPASFEEVSVHQTRDDLDGETSPLHRDYKRFDSRESGNTLKVAAVTSGGNLHVVVGREDLRHSELIKSRVSPGALPHSFEIAGGAFIRIDWKSGQIELYGDSETIIPMDKQVRQLVQQSLMRVVERYKALAPGAT
jgi:hypothetical protein